MQDIQRSVLRNAINRTRREECSRRNCINYFYFSIMKLRKEAEIEGETIKVTSVIPVTKKNLQTESPISLRSFKRSQWDQNSECAFIIFFILVNAIVFTRFLWTKTMSEKWKKTKYTMLRLPFKYYITLNFSLTFLFNKECSKCNN